MEVVMSACAGLRRIVVVAVLVAACVGVEQPAAGQWVRYGLGQEIGLASYILASPPPLGEGAAGVLEEVPGVPLMEELTIPEGRQPAGRPDTSTMLASRSPIIRLAGLPNMFGDSFGSQLQVCDFDCCGVMDLPPPGGGRQAKISENDKALPMCRLFGVYNHFHNAVDISTPCLGVDSYPIDQYTIGYEKRFCFYGTWSVELAMPFSTTPRIVGTNLEVNSGDIGNLVVTLKRLLRCTQYTAVGIGLPVELPTGSDVTGRGTVSSYTLQNDSIHLAPFIGFVSAPGERVFLEGFVQVDLPINGNQVHFGDSYLGTLTEQNLLYVDLGVGYWLHRNQCSRLITGLATMVEYHYTTALEDAEMVSGNDGHQVLTFGNMYNRMDISNLTVGLHTEMGMTTLRVGGSFPLSNACNRLYDAEVQVSVNRNF
jgi:hypothetical protein